MPPDPASVDVARKERQTGHKRTYQACRACRTAKLRCDLGDPDAPHEPPCRRCLRTGRECVFGGVYHRADRRSAVSPRSLRDPRGISIIDGGAWNGGAMEWKEEEDLGNHAAQPSSSTYVHECHFSQSWLIQIDPTLFIKMHIRHTGRPRLLHYSL
jgi:hypothetical protein